MPNKRTAGLLSALPWRFFNPDSYEFKQPSHQQSNVIEDLEVQTEDDLEDGEYEMKVTVRPLDVMLKL